ncbi:hypothetical protein BC835DRAFT_1362542 [Cytidiella melzeri]|nr:hypothetical protein BC835DRAFT_1362542 [Cytidiella melzeri]
MSSVGGTQSPSLDSSGQNEPMGVSNIQGDKPKAVPDSKQREQYFQQSETAPAIQTDATATAQIEKAKQD